MEIWQQNIKENKGAVKVEVQSWPTGTYPVVIRQNGNHVTQQILIVK